MASKFIVGRLKQSCSRNQYLKVSRAGVCWVNTARTPHAFPPIPSMQKTCQIWPVNKNNSHLGVIFWRVHIPECQISKLRAHNVPKYRHSKPLILKLKPIFRRNSSNTRRYYVVTHQRKLNGINDSSLWHDACRQWKQRYQGTFH